MTPVDEFDHLDEPITEAEYKEVVAFTLEQHAGLADEMQRMPLQRFPAFYRLLVDDMRRVQAGRVPRYVPYYNPVGESIMTTLKYDPATVPERMRGLPVDPKRQYLIPWFVDWVNGEPEFRAMDPNKWVRAIKERLCWVCGQPLGRHLAFLLGPMRGITRTTVEPPCHLECAEWSAQNCPFLNLLYMVRREDELTDKMLIVGGFAIKRNPGCMAVWVTRSYKTFKDGRGGMLITVGEPEQILWYAEGRAATRAEIDASVESGFPLLMGPAESEGPEAVAELNRDLAVFQKLLPCD